jgi:uncharacterized protein YajQ (UPF0234 family)
MPSFQVVSNTDLMEVDNAINNVLREIKNRFDFKGANCNIERSDHTLTVTADDNMKLTQLDDLIQTNFIRRGIDQKALNFHSADKATGDSLRQQVEIKHGIDKETAQKISKSIRGTKIKVQASIEGEELRVSGKNRDDLQKIIQFIKEIEIDQPLQYVNFRD